MNTQADALDAALGSWDFFGPMTLLFGFVSLVALGFRWAKHVGRQL